MSRGVTTTLSFGSNRSAQRAPVRSPEFTSSFTERSGCTASMKPPNVVWYAVSRIAERSPIGTFNATFALPPMPPSSTEFSENSPKPSELPSSGWFVM